MADSSITADEPIAIIGIGAPGCGKTSLLKPLAARKNYTYINADDIREELTGDPTDHEHEPAVWRIVHERIASALPSTGIVLDATHTRRNARTKMIRYCRAHGARRIVGYWFNTPIDVCLTRNKVRDRKVPNEVIRVMHDRLKTTPPTLEEGFDDLIQVI